MAKIKINYKQPKYVLPAILYLPLIGLGWLVIDIFHTEVAETADPRLKTTNYLNDKLPDANVKELGDKRSNMRREFGGISDLTAVDALNPDSVVAKEGFETQYSAEEAELIARQEQERESEAQARRAALRDELDRSAQNGSNMRSNDFESQLSEEERELYRQMRRNDLLAEMRRNGSGLDDDDIDDESVPKPSPDTLASETKEMPKNAVAALDEDAEENVVVKKVAESSARFNTLSENQTESNLIKAIVDEETKASDGSRIRLRLLDDIDINGKTLPKGTYLYATVNGFGGQRVRGNIRSVLVDDNLMRVALSLYDMDGLEGLYVPQSAFMETARDVASSATQQGNFLDENNSNRNNAGRWANQAIHNAANRTTQAIGRAIRKNKVRIKYGTQVYLVNGNKKR